MSHNPLIASVAALACLVAVGGCRFGSAPEAENPAPRAATSAPPSPVQPVAADPAQWVRSPAAPAGFSIKRCVNLGALEAPREGEWGYAVRFEDLRRIREAGFDSVRLPVKASDWAGPAPGFSLDETRMRRVDEIIANALSAGLGVILDVHHFEEIHNDAYGQSAKLAALWSQLAARYRGQSDALVFELLNEPKEGLVGAPLDHVLAAALAAVRAVDRNRLVIVGGPDWSSVNGLAQFKPPSDPRLIATVHYYSPFEFTHENASFMKPAPRFGRPWGGADDRAALERDFDRVAAWAQQHGLHMFIGEFGVNEQVNTDQRAAWTRAARLAAERRGMSWCAWDWATTFKIYDARAETWVDPVRSALFD